MKIKIQAVKFSLTPSIYSYVEKALLSLERLVHRFDEEGAAEMRIEVGRVSHHHHKGDVFRAEVNLRLPGKVLRAVSRGEILNQAIDKVKDKLKREIEKYRTKQGR